MTEIQTGTDAIRGHNKKMNILTLIPPRAAEARTEQAASRRPVGFRG